MSETEIAWVAGLLEGEGNFKVEKRYPRERVRPSVRIAMTDRDVIERYAELVGGSVRPIPIREGRKQLFECTVRGKRAQDVLRMVRPHLGKRRGIKADELLSIEVLKTGRPRLLT